MPELCNDSRTYCFIEDERETFDVQTGGRSGTPTLEVPVINGNMVEVTAQFIAKNPDGGFSYTINSTSDDAKKITRRESNICQNSGGWQSCVRTDIFVAHLPTASADEDVSFEVVFDAATLDNPGQAGAFLLSARLVGSKLL